jgi:hypothetical protein
MDAEVTVRDVKRAETRSGNTRWTLVDEAGKEYTTFRPAIGEQAERAKGNRATISFHEQERGGFHNVYLDAVEPVSVERPASAADDADEVAWGTAVEAAPWLLGTSEPDEEISPDELYEKLEPFKRRVAEDIRERDDKPS